MARSNVYPAAYTGFILGREAKNVWMNTDAP